MEASDTPPQRKTAATEYHQRKVDLYTPPLTFPAQTPGKYPEELLSLYTLSLPIYFITDYRLHCWINVHTLSLPIYFITDYRIHCWINVHTLSLPIYFIRDYRLHCWKNVNILHLPIYFGMEYTGVLISP